MHSHIFTLSEICGSVYETGQLCVTSCCVTGEDKLIYFNISPTLHKVEDKIFHSERRDAVVNYKAGGITAKTFLGDITSLNLMLTNC